MPARRVLIVDYHTAVADTLAQIFSLVGYEVRAEYAGESAVAVVSEWPPDLAILDFILSGISGLECANLLRERYPNCRFILLFAQVRDSLIHDALARGYKVLGKPIDPQVLLDTAQALLDAPTHL